jgi:sirohydrochlorin ferrochelatase
MRRFSALLATRAGIPIWQVAFLAMARPQIAEAIAQVDLNATSRVIVQPHLLFHGDLVEQLRGQVAQTAAERPGQEWIVTGLLADATLGGGESSELLTAAMEDLIEQTLKPW